MNKTLWNGAYFDVWTMNIHKSNTTPLPIADWLIAEILAVNRMSWDRGRASNFKTQVRGPIERTIIGY